MIGKTLAHYDILAEIGAGGMGTVYRARDTKLGREVAIKVLPPNMASDTDRLKRFQREARTVAALSHPNIVTVYSVEAVGEPDPVHFLTMELIRGETLAQSLPADGFALDSILEIAIPLADAMTLAHEQGVIHRDLKPANIMRDPSGRIRVLDFGLASLRESAEQVDGDVTLEALTAAGQIMGTAAYMAPEQLDGRPVDHRADIFALGVILYEMASGKPPFHGDSVAAIASSVLRDEPPSLAEQRPDLPLDLLRIIRRCLQKDFDRRIQTVRDVRNELEELRRAAVPESEVVSVPESTRILAHRRFVLTAEHVRALTQRVPRMVGDALTYLDNEANSDTLVLCLHGFGQDEESFESVLNEIPHRAVAVSLFGFGPDASIRPPLPMVDHLSLLTAFMTELNRRIRPRHRILVGDSSGADTAIRWMASEHGANLGIDGLVTLGLNTNSQGPLVSGEFAQLDDDPKQVLDALKGMGNRVQSLDIWLTIHRYLVSILEKFETDLSPLRQHGKDISQPFVEDEDAMYSWLNACLRVVPHVRCVFAKEETQHAEAMLSRHLDENILGDHFTEDMIAISSAHHFKLSEPEALLPHLSAIVDRTKAAKALEARAAVPDAVSEPDSKLIRSLAVLPLDNHSGDPAQDFFADGMTEAITAEVAKVGKLRVISRTSVMQYKGSRKSITQIAEELNVDAIVEGSVLRSGNRVRITAQLIHAAKDEHLWAETYDRDMEDILELQSEVSRAIVGKIQVSLISEDVRPTPRRVDPDAYESYLKGRFCWNQRSNESLRRGLLHFQEVIAKDPTYAQAYVGMAECYNVLGFQGATSPRESFAPAMAAARRALELDPSIAEAYTSLGYASIHYDYDWEGAERAFQKGIQLNPNYPTAHHWYALFLANMNRREEAISEIEIAWELDPLAPIMRTAFGWLHYMFGDSDVALENYRKVQEITPGFRASRLMAGFAYTSKGMYPEAKAEVQAAIGESGEEPMFLAAIGYTEALAGNHQRAREILNEMGAMAGTQYVRPYDLALVHIGLGEMDVALTLLEKAYEERGNWLNYMRIDPVFNTLRSEPRFQGLVDKIFS